MNKSDTINTPTVAESIRPTINPSVNYSTAESNNSSFSNKRTIIIILCVIIFFMLFTSGVPNFIQTLFNSIYEFFMGILKSLGYITGSAINTTADVTGDVLRTGIDISEGTLHSIGNILSNTEPNTIPSQSQKPQQPESQPIDEVINVAPVKTEIVVPDNATNSIQNPIVANKSSWCLIGEYKGRRGCMEISEYDKCMSGQVFPTQSMCLNPVLAQNP